MKCPNCQRENEQTYRFCIFCGSPLQACEARQLSENIQAEALADADLDSTDCNHLNIRRVQMKVSINYAGFRKRFVAWIIDVLIMIPLLIATGYAVYVYLEAASPYDFVDAQVGAFSLFVSFGCVISLFNISFWAWRGQTPGKMVMRMKIVKSDGRQIGIGRAVLRYIGLIIPVVVIIITCFVLSIFSPNIAGGILLYIGIPVGPILVFLPLLMIIWDGKKQGLHDKIAGTYVVNIPQLKTLQSVNNNTQISDS